MDQAINPYAPPQSGAHIMSGVEALLVDGNVSLGKNKGQGQLLFTRTTLFAFRQNNQSQMMAGILGGLLGVLILHLYQKYFAKKPTPPDHLADPEIVALVEPTRKKIERSTLLAKFPLTSEFQIERTRLGFKISSGVEEQIVYQGLIHKKKITQFLAAQGIEVR